MKRNRGEPLTPPSKRQQSIAGFFARPKQKGNEEVKSEDIIDLRVPEQTAIASTVKKVGPVYTVLSTDEYPLPNHPSYHLPPTTSYNHPFPPSPIPQSLLTSLKFNSTSKSITNPELGLDLLYFKPFIERTASRELLTFLLDTLPWYRVKYVVRGININTPRWTTVFGKDRTGLPWESYKCKPRAIPPILLRLMQKGTSILVLGGYS